MITPLQQVRSSAHDRALAIVIVWLGRESVDEGVVALRLDHECARVGRKSSNRQCPLISVARNIESDGSDHRPRPGRGRRSSRKRATTASTVNRNVIVEIL